MLSKLGLPGFGRANWQSKIPREVRVHEKYKDLTPWNGTETVDFVYEEGKENGGVEDYKFSVLLYDNHYLPDEALRKDARIKYYMEVKTTTEGCEDRFYMSRAQYRMVRSTHRSVGMINRG